jgi:uncharacterized hydrophobic protein (TIGR00271 family)
MRLVKLLVATDSKDDVLDVLESENIDFVLTKDASERRDTVLVEFPLPTQAVEYVMSELREAGVDDREYTVIASAETAKTRNFHELEDRFVAGVEEDDSVAREEIRAKALDMHRNALTYYSMTVFSAIVAAAGLLMDSPAVVVGAMVIAPQVGSALIASVGISLNDRRMMYLGFRDQVLGFAAAVAGAFVLGTMLKSGQIVTSVLDVSTIGQISKRISPGLLSVLVGLCAGAAGAFGLATALPVSLVGVMIAAALIPAAAAIGIGLAWQLPSVSIGASLLLIVNAVAVNLAAFGVLWYLGYRPASWDETTAEEASDGSLVDGREVLPGAVAIGVLVVVFLGAGGALGSQVAFDNAANDAVEEVLDDERYRELELTSVSTEVAMVGTVGQTPEVTVVVTRPADVPYPGLAAEIRDQVQNETDRSVAVSVEFEDTLQAGRSGPSSARRPDGLPSAASPTSTRGRTSAQTPAHL